MASKPTGAFKIDTDREVEIEFIPKDVTVTGFSVRPGARLSQSQADTYGPEILKVRKKVGDEFTPASIVDAARVASSPLHEYFEWDDETAAENWRYEQARGLMRFINIKWTDGKQVFSARMMHALYRKVEKPYWNNLGAMLTLEDKHQMWLEQALSELHSWVKIYGLYKSLKPLADKIERFIEEFE